jgi:Predicted permeases
LERILTASKLIVPLLIMLILGALFRRKKIITSQGITDIKSVIFNICLPAVIFNAFYNASYDRGTLVILPVVFLACLAALFIGIFLNKLLKKAHDSMPFLVTGMESGMLGYTLYGLLFGVQNTGSFAVIDFGHEIFIFTVFMTLLNIKSGNQTYTLKKAAASMLKSPPFIAIIAGLIVGATGAGAALNASAAGGILTSTISFISAPISALILLVIGFGIEFSRANVKAAFKTILIRIGIYVVLCEVVYFVLASLVPMSSQMKWAVIMLFILPPPFVLPIFIKKEEEQQYVSTSLSLYTLLSICAFAVMAFIAV